MTNMTYRYTNRQETKFAQNLSRHRKEFVRYMRCTECLPDTMTPLGIDDGTVSKICQISFSSGECDANELFLLKFEQSTAPGKWPAFIGALEDLGYEFLVKLLRGETVCPTREQDVELIKSKTWLVSHKLDPTEVDLNLESSGCLSQSDVQNIGKRTETMGKIDGAKLLLDRVTRRKDNWFVEFKEALQKAGLHELMKDLDAEITVSCSQVENDAQDGVREIGEEGSVGERVSTRRRGGRIVRIADKGTTGQGLSIERRFLTEPDLTVRRRAQHKREEKKRQAQDVIKRVPEKLLREIISQVARREPGLVLYVCEKAIEPNRLQFGREDVPSWCICGHCVPMPTHIESICCDCLPGNCISQRKEIETLVLDPQWSRQGREEYNDKLRQSAYGNFTRWQIGSLGRGKRRVIPSCVVRRVREAFPLPTNTYTGFVNTH